MADDTNRTIQTKLKLAGFYTGEIDGQWGNLSDNALDAALAAAKLRNVPTVDEKAMALIAATKSPVKTLCWGKKVSPEFRDRIDWIGGQLQTDANLLMACMAWESAETFSPRVTNAAGSGATGLIQFMPSTAAGLGTTIEKLAAMTAEDQLNYVYKYFSPYKGRLKTLADVYMVILWPGAVGAPESSVLFDKADPKFPKRYLQNKGLDVDGNGKVTKAEAAAKVQAKYDRGMTPAFLYSA